MGQGGGVADITEGDADVAQQAAAFGPQNRRTGKTGCKTGLVQLKQGNQIRRVPFGTRVSLHQLTFAGEAVPGTDREAIVTAEDTIADGGAQFEGNGALQLDGEIGDAFAGIELEGGSDGIGRTGG